MKSKLIVACEKAADLAQKHCDAVAEATRLFELKYGKEPHEDSAFMAWVSYGETPSNYEHMDRTQGLEEYEDV